MIEIEKYEKEKLRTFAFDISDTTVLMSFYIIHIGSSESQRIKLLDINIAKGNKEISSNSIHLADNLLDTEFINAANIFWTQAISDYQIYKTKQSFTILPNIYFGIFSESESTYCYLFEKSQSDWLHNDRLDYIQDDNKSFIKVSSDNGLMFHQLIRIAPSINKYVSSLLKMGAEE